MEGADAEADLLEGAEEDPLLARSASSRGVHDAGMDELDGLFLQEAENAALMGTPIGYLLPTMEGQLLSPPQPRPDAVNPPSQAPRSTFRKPGAGRGPSGAGRRGSGRKTATSQGLQGPRPGSFTSPVAARPQVRM
jgi:hypothetical protein